MNNKYFNLVKRYNPRGKINRDEFSFLFTLQNVIICGDFNSKNLIWGSNTTDLNGRLIQELLDENDLHLLNDVSGTHITFSGNQTPFDLTFVSNSLSHISNWNVENDTLGSDHFLIRIELYQKRKVNEVNSKCNLWNYKKAKWNLFRENLETLSNNRNHTEINKYWKSISKEITGAAVIYIPKVKQRIKNPVPYWNEECNEAIKERKRARRKIIKSKLPQDFIVYKQKKALAQKIIKSSKKQYWQHYCNSLNKNSNLNKIGKQLIK